MWRCVSIMPGRTIPPDASISYASSGASRFGPTPAITPSTTSTSASRNTSWASFMVSTVPRRSTTGRPASIVADSLNVPPLLDCRAPFQVPVARSRNQHELRCAARFLLARPRFRDALERDLLEFDDDLAATDVADQRRVALAPDLDRRMGDREPSQVERDRAQRGRRDGDLEAGELADLDVACVPGGGPDGRERRGA